MAKIRPFQAIRPKKGMEDKIAALPYDVYNREEARAEVERQPLSFLRIDRAETQFGSETGTYDDCVYEKANHLLWDMVERGEFVTDNNPCYYVYELVMSGRSQTGIAACASIDDYLNQKIKKHENTREDKEVDRIRHVSSCGAQTGPIFLAYRSDCMINELIDAKKKEEPLYDFTTEDGIIHRMWVISEDSSVAAIQSTFEQMEEIYIADGHHRCASAVKVGLNRRSEKQDYTGEEEFNYFLSVLFPDDQLLIMDYNRVIRDLNGNSPKEFLSKLSGGFEVEALGLSAYRPERKGQFGMYLEGSWYRLTAKEHIRSAHPVDGLDVSILQKEVLAPILGIEDPKTDQTIDFVGGIRGLEELERRVNSDCKVAFAMYPTDIAELFAVSDAGLLMPPKSTWFEPKLRSGLLIHSIRD